MERWTNPDRVRIYFDDVILKTSQKYNYLKQANLKFTFSDNQGKEVISKIVTDLKTDKVFYTDSNGRELLKRKYVEFNLSRVKPIGCFSISFPQGSITDQLGS